MSGFRQFASAAAPRGKTARPQSRHARAERACGSRDLSRVAMSSRTYRGSLVVRAARGGARPYRVRVGVFMLAAVVVVVVVVVVVHGRPRGGEERERGGREEGGRCAGHPSKTFGGYRARGDSGGCTEGQTFVVGVTVVVTGKRRRRNLVPLVDFGTCPNRIAANVLVALG